MTWYIQTRNGGMYSHIITEQKACEELQVLFNKAYEARKNGQFVSVELWNGTWSHGYFSDVRVISEETLEEMYVSYDWGETYGDFKWSFRNHDTGEECHYESDHFSDRF